MLSRQRTWETARSEKALAVATYLGLGLAILPALFGLIRSLANREWASCAAWALLLVALSYSLRRILFRHTPEPPPPTRFFQPFLPLNAETAWPRPNDVEDILRAIDSPQTSVPVIIGSSGVGKSTLLKLLVKDEAQRRVPGIRYVHLSRYDNIRQELERLSQEPLPHVVVLDQFEQWLASVRHMTVERRLAEQRWLREWLETARLRGQVAVISLRREWYYDLRFLGELAPAPQNCYDVQGPPASTLEDKTRAVIADRFMSVLGSEDLTEKLLLELSNNGRILPLEAQIVGATLEQARERGERVDENEVDVGLGGIGGIIDSYFRRILTGAPNQRVCLKVLCALSARTRFRRQEDLSDILGRLFEDDEAVRSSITYLEAQNLVSRGGVGRYELVHDYLAEFFNAKSGSELSPIDRDNILFHLEASGSTNKSVLKVTSTSEQRGLRLGGIVAVAGILLLAARLLYFGLDWTLVGRLVSQPATTNLLDATFVPVFVPLVGWAIYIGLFYDRVLIRLREGRAARTFSVFVVVNMFACILISIFIPFAWLAALGLGGAVMGAKLLQLSRRNDMNHAARDRLKEFGRTTFFSLIFLLGLGLFTMYLSFLTVDSTESSRAWILANLFLSTMMTYACLTLAPLHVSRRAVSQLLGLMGRSRAAAIPRPE